MERDSFPTTDERHRTRKRTGRRARGLAVKERHGSWHIVGTVRAGGRSIRLRRSLGLPATAATYDQAWDEARAIEADVRAQAMGLSGRGDNVAIALKSYIERKRARPLGPSTIRILKEVVTAFGRRQLNDVRPQEWKAWIDQRHSTNSAQTRERFISTVAAFHVFAREHHGLSSVVKFDRNKEARNPRRRQRRHVEELSVDLIGRLLQAAHISLRAQLAAEWSTGARVSSVLYGVQVRDVTLTPGRETITYRRTKNGDDVTAALHPTAAAILADYAKWRGGLLDREAPFFLTYKRLPYADNGRSSGGQNKTAFRAAARRARRQLLAEAFDKANALKMSGLRAQALDGLLATRNDVRLLRRVTQHWFRHLLATRMRHDIRAAMEQGGWRDERSILGYIHDVPEARRAIVNGFDDFGTSLTRPSGLAAVSA